MENKSVKGITTVNLRIRKSPSLKADILDIIKKGTVVKVYLQKSSKDFYYIYKEGITGYCLKDYITLPKQKQNNKGE